MSNPGVLPKSQGDKITYQDYNAVRAVITPVLRAGSGSVGYGSTTNNSSDVSQNGKITKNHWDTLRQDIDAAITHQTGSASGIATVTTLTKVGYTTLNAYYTAAQTAVTNSLNVAAGQTALATGRITYYATPWNTQISGSITYAFGDADSVRNFFNAGGNLRLSSSLTNVITSKDQSWKDLSTAFGAAYYTRSNWSTGGNVVIKGPVYSSYTAYTTNYIQVWGEYFTGNNSVMLSIIFNDASIGGGTSFDETIGANIVVAGDYYKSSPAISAPEPSLFITSSLGSGTGTPAGRVLAIAPTSFATVYTGSAINQSMSASGGTAPYTWSVTSGSLPTGLTLSSSGVITGTVTAFGNFTFTIRVTDAANPQGAGTRTYTWSVPPALTVLPSAIPQWSVGTNLTGQGFGATGGTAPYTFTVSAGSLPPGISINTSGVGTGSPTLAGTYPFTITLTDSSVPQGLGVQSYTQVVTPALLISPASLTSINLGAPATQVFTGSGGLAPYTWGITTGAVPTGMTFYAGNVTIKGTPSTTGTYTFSLGFYDSAYTTAFVVQNYSWSVINPALGIAPSSLGGAQQFNSFSQTFVGTGGVAPYSFSIVAGTIPSGLSFDAPTATLSGFPDTTGSYSFDMQVTDSSTPTRSGTVSYTIDVRNRPTLNGSITLRTNSAQKQTRVRVTWDSSAGGNQSYVVALSAGTEDTTTGAPLTGTLNFSTTSVDIYIQGAHTAGYATLNLSRNQYTTQVDTVAYPANTTYSPYTYAAGYSQEYSRVGSSLTLAQAIGNNFFASNQSFTPTAGITRYGLNRNPTAATLDYWVSYALGNGISSPQTSTAFMQAFFNSLTGTDATRSQTSSKSFDAGTGYGDFYDRP